MPINPGEEHALSFGFTLHIRISMLQLPRGHKHHPGREQGLSRKRESIVITTPLCVCVFIKERRLCVLRAYSTSAFASITSPAS
eukprot:1245372-Pyramimonas_sp.AAC.1